MKYLITVVLFIGFIPGQLACAEEPPRKVEKKGVVGGKANQAKKGVAGPARWEETIRQFEMADSAMPPPKGAVLLIGGSNARRWTDVGDYFPQHQVINRGFGGAQLSDVLHFADRIVLPYAPKSILLNAGGNDLNAGKSPTEVRDLASQFVAKVHAALPDTQILYIGLPPVLRTNGRPEVLAAIREMNKLLAELEKTEKHFKFIDLLPSFLDEQDRSKPELFVEDGTHFSPKGYAAVATLVREKL